MRNNGERIFSAVHIQNQYVIRTEHVDRMSNEMASLADEMSRRRVSLSGNRRKALQQAEFREMKSYLLKGLKNPCKSGNLYNMIQKGMRD